MQGRNLPNQDIQVFPLGTIVTGPDTAIAVRTDVRGPGKQKITVWQKLVKLFGAAPGHQAAVQIVHVVMYNRF